MRPVYIAVLMALGWMLAAQRGTADGAEEKSEETGKKPAYEQVFGRVASLTVTERQSVLVIDKPHAASQRPDAPAAEVPMKFFLNQHSAVTDGTHELNPSDLNVGQHVRVLFRETWLGRRIVQAIIVQP